jgi:sulfide:quinone oxidoreductase
LQDPGPVVLGATQGASCFGAEYEVAFNLDRALRKAGVRDQAPVTFLTAEPFLGHLGFGGIGQGRYVLEDRFRKQQIEWITSASIDQATPGEMHLADGRVLPFKYSVVIPPFRGSQVLRDTPDLANAQGFVPVNNHYRHTTYDNVYAAGVIVAASSPEETPVPCGVPKTGLMCEIMGKTAAHNIVADLTGKQPKELPFNDLHTMCVLDTGESAFMVASDRIFGDRNIAIFTREGPWWHWFKMGFEQYHTWKMRTGRVYLP